MADKYTKERYIGMFDILGFKERVKEKNHVEIYNELKQLKTKNIKKLKTVVTAKIMRFLRLCELIFLKAICSASFIICPP